jgi:chromosome segregation ATPase
MDDPNYNSTNNLSPQIYNYDEILEYKKYISKLENLAKNQEHKIESLTKLYDDLKELNKRTQKECTELNNKLIALYDEKTNLEKKYQNELEKQKSNQNKQKEVYEQQILKLSSYNPESLKNKVTSEIEIKYKTMLQNKDNEIDELSNTLSEEKRKYELLLSEYETYKMDMQRQYNSVKEIHDNEMKDLLNRLNSNNEKNSSNLDKDIFMNLKSELDNARHHINELETEVEKLRREKELLTIERNELKLNSMKDVDKEKFANKMLYTENERNRNLMDNLHNEINNYKDTLNRKEIEIKELLNDKLNLTKSLSDRDSEFQMLKMDVLTLRNLIETQEKNYNDIINQTEKEKKENLYRERTDKENYEKQIDDLTTELKDTKINFKNHYEQIKEDLYNKERDFNIANEQKRLLIKQNEEMKNELDVIKNDYENKSKQLTMYEQEYLNMQDKYRIINQKNIELNGLIDRKDKEIKNLNSDGKNIEYKELLKKYNELYKKKKYYKDQCKQTNINIENFINKLQPEDKKNFMMQAGNNNNNLNYINAVISQSEGSANEKL